MKKLYTTGDVARLLGTTISTVIKWFDEGRLVGFRLPNSQDRRIPYANLRSFMATNGISMDLLEDGGLMYRRAHHRAPCSGDVTFSLIHNGENRPMRGRLVDVSQGGARLVYYGTDQFALPAGAKRMHVKVHDGPLAGMDLPSQLVHVRIENEALAIGLRFTNLGKAQSDRIGGVVHQPSAPGRRTA